MHEIGCIIMQLHPLVFYSEIMHCDVYYLRKSAIWVLTIYGPYGSQAEKTKIRYNSITILLWNYSKGESFARRTNRTVTNLNDIFNDI